MGINSTGVAYNFGQLGSTFVTQDENTVTAPKGMAIIAITFFGDSTIGTLISKDPTNFANTASAANSTGTYSRTVNQGNATTDKIIFDQENAGTGNNDAIEVGDEVFDGATGVSHGTVIALNPDGDNTKEIQISASVAITNDEVLAFVKPANLTGYRGTGGQAITGVTIAGGTTIYGRWDSVILGDDNSSAIVYFGQ